MFLPKNKVSLDSFEKISAAVQDDLREYSCEMREDDFVGATWSKAFEETQFIDKQFPSCPDVSEFAEKLLPWLDKRKQQNQTPWVQQGQIHVLNAKHIKSFLEDLSHWLSCLVFERGTVPVFGEDGGLSFGLQGFGKFIAGRRLSPNKWAVSFEPVPLSWRPFTDTLPDFISWLIVCPASATREDNWLHIIYDKDKIQENLDSKKDLEEICRRIDKIYIHEIGHGRTFLKWYLANLNQLKVRYPNKWWWGPKTISGEQLISSPAVSEFYAWAYTLAFRNCVMSTRCWVARILSNKDSEWKNI